MISFVVIVVVFLVVVMYCSAYQVDFEDYDQLYSFVMIYFEASLPRKQILLCCYRYCHLWSSVDVFTLYLAYALIYI